MERLPEEPVEQRSRRAGLVGRAHLAEDLALARDERVESGRDAEQVQARGLVAQAVERLLDRRLELGERGDGGPLRRLRIGTGDVQLGAVAGREADRLAAALREPRRERRRLLPVERDALSHLDGRVMVRGADEDEAHQAKWVAGRARRTTITSTKPASAR